MVDCIVATNLPSCQTEEDVVTLQEFATMIYAGEHPRHLACLAPLVLTRLLLAGADTVRILLVNVLQME